eukprot:scaffold7446_cov403-Prasinococcus_capsulatus_cf.AAC.7
MGWSIVAGVFCFVLGYLVSIDYDYLGEWYDADLRIDNPGESCRGSADNTDCVLFSETQDDATSAAYAVRHHAAHMESPDDRHVQRNYSLLITKCWLWPRAGWRSVPGVCSSISHNRHLQLYAAENCTRSNPLQLFQRF